MSQDFYPLLPHGPIEEVFPDVFFVTGTMRNEFFGSMWQFSRNMTIVREDGKLTLINSVRLSDEGLASLEALGDVVNMVHLGSMHGCDHPFFLHRYRPTLWALPGMPGSPDKELTVGGEIPFADCSLFAFDHTKLPEGILRLDREGGVMIACDSLQNWVEPDQFFDESTIATMTEMGFFAPANLGPAWMHVNEPKAEDFVRLKEIAFEHALCGHGTPLRGGADKDYRATYKRLFDV